jgi:Zn-dependent protease/predicted transcriptional regulator
MFGRSFRLVTLRGIPVNVDASWIWIAVLAVYTLYARLEGRFDVGTAGALGYAVLGALLFFGSVFLHELAHAVTARLSGIEVEGITLVFFGGFTAARSEDKGAGPAFAISALGPMTSLALAVAFWLASVVIDGAAGPLPGLLRYVAVINAFMAVFNVLPGLPLDGGRMLQAAVWAVTGNRERGTTVAAYGGMVVGGLLFAAALYELSRSQDVFSALWLALIGSFIFQGARSARTRIGMGERLARGTVADVMDPPPPAVPGDLSLSEALDRFLRGHEGEAFPVVDDDRVIGMISFSSARPIGAEDPLRPARDAIIPLDNVMVASPDETLDAVAERLGPARSALVLREGHLVGAISGGAVYRYAARRG